MPNYFSFTAPGAPSPTSLVDVEREFVTDLEGPEAAAALHPKRWHPAFSILTEIVAVQGADRGKWDAMWTKLRTSREWAEDDERFLAVAEQYVFGPKYHADAWYQPR